MEEYAIQKILGLTTANNHVETRMTNNSNTIEFYEKMQLSLREAGADQTSYAIAPDALNRDAMYAEREGRI